VPPPPPAGRTLVFGSFPPVPGPASDATVAILRQTWASGTEAVSVSPRAAAADHAARVSGPLAGRRLTAVRELAGGPTRLILGLEDGVPVSASSVSSSRWRKGWDAGLGLLALRGLLPALRRFDHVTLVISGPTGVARLLLRSLWAHADVVLVTAGGAAEAVRLRVPPALVEHVEVPAHSAAAPGVSALGPPEVLARDVPLWLVGRVGRKVLGDRFYACRFLAVRIVRKVQRTIRPAARR
jgi:hypothetical protein